MHVYRVIINILSEFIIVLMHGVNNVHVFHRSATLHYKLEVFRMLQRTSLHMNNLQLPTDKPYIICSLLSWNYIVCGKRFQLLFSQHSVHRAS